MAELALCVGLGVVLSAGLGTKSARAQSCLADPSWTLERGAIEGPGDASSEMALWPAELWLSGASGDSGFVEGGGVALELRREG